MRKIPSKEVIQALAVTAEVMGTQLSDAAGKMMAQDLAIYPPQQVLGALAACRKQVKGRLTTADIIARLDDGRPGPEEAWAMIPKDEYASVVWTDEMARASGVARSLIDQGELIPARMAFLEAYRAEVQHARDNAVPVRWTPSLGDDKLAREAVLLEAAEKGRLSPPHVMRLLPGKFGDEIPQRIAGLLGDTKMLRGD